MCILLAHALLQAAIALACTPSQLQLSAVHEAPKTSASLLSCSSDFSPHTAYDGPNTPLSRHGAKEERPAETRQTYMSVGRIP